MEIWTGQAVTTPGLYVDGHGHQVLLRSGELAPICTSSGATVIRWRLMRSLPLLPRPR